MKRSKLQFAIVLGVVGNNLPSYSISLKNLPDYKNFVVKSFRKYPDLEDYDEEMVYKLSLKNKNISDLDGIENIPDIENLTDLDLSGNQLTTLPKSISNLKWLQILNLSDNRLTPLPESIGNLTQLRDLNLSANQLTTLPESIGNLTQLRDLNLSANQLTTLPESISNLKQLQILNLSDNRLTPLPESIGNITGLEELNLSANQLTTLPESISNLKWRLWSLNLSANQLTTLPESISNLKQLKILNLRNNPIDPTTVPAFADTLSEGFKKAIKDYEDQYGNTLLYKAAELGNQKVIDNLIKYGLTMNTRNEKGITPQMIFDKTPT